MNILFISPNSPRDSIGGVERYLNNLIDYGKTRKDLKITILLPTNEKSYVEKHSNVTIYFEECLYVSKNEIQLKREVSDKARNFATVLQDIIKNNEIEIISAENFHIGLPPAYSLLLCMTANLYKIPVVLRVHSFASKDIQTELINQLPWSHVSCVSKSVAGDCFHKGADINILSTDYLGVDTSKFYKYLEPQDYLKKKLKLPSDSKIILSATRIILGKKSIIKEKGLINLIEAFSQIVRNNNNVNLVIAIGKPSPVLQDEFEFALDMLLGYVKLHNIQKKTFVKMFKLNEMPKVYNGADMFVLPSENETFGQVFVEAMACGVPVIGTKVGGIPEIITDAYNGYLIHPQDSSLLAQKMNELLSKEPLRNRFITAAKESVENQFTAKTQFDNYFTMLNEVTKS
jgi:glycosyltransferase involved in cell wall biosynthesis